MSDEIVSLEQLQALAATVAREAKQPSPAGGDSPLEPLDMSDLELLEKARSAKNGTEFGRLFDGNWDAGKFPSQSEADEALCFHLAFWTRKDRDRMDRLFRQSGLMRPKWDEARPEGTYGSITIDRAIAGCAEVYEPKGVELHRNGHQGKPAIITQPGARPESGSAKETTESPMVAPANSWPTPPAEAAFYGLAGEFTRLVEPHTEADPIAILSQFLVFFGNSIGRGPHFIAEGHKHYTNLFATLVGATSKGRKGSSLEHVRNLYHQVDSVWVEHRIVSGLSSGEGLIHAVRDRVERTVTDREKGDDGKVHVKGFTQVVEDPGEPDKRLLVIQPEFASVLKIAGREGNTLSPVIREAWDSGNLRTLTRHSPAKATNAHISIIGHISKDELLKHFRDTEAANGFGNRFLWLCVRRSKVLPEGGDMASVNLAGVIKRLHEAIDFARKKAEIRRDGGAARDRWYEVYEVLSEGKPGLLGAVTSRAEAQVMRLALLYALLDRSDCIRVEHLNAALALWQYAEDSARWIFGDKLGDPIADEIYRALLAKPDGLTTKAINHEVFARNLPADHLRRALTVLVEYGLVYSEQVPHEGPGRIAELWKVKRLTT